MATIQKRKNKNRTISYRVMIRPSDGFPAMYKTWPTYEEAKRRQGIYFPEKLKKKHTVAELIDLYAEALPHLGVKSAEDILRHLNWWKAKIGKYTLNHINSESLAGFRFLEFLAWGKVLYIDDLISDAAARQNGYGSTLLKWVIGEAKKAKCDQAHLDSGPQRHDAHRLYLNYGFKIIGHHFALDLKCLMTP